MKAYIDLYHAASTPHDVVLSVNGGSIIVSFGADGLCRNPTAAQVFAMEADFPSRERFLSIEIDSPLKKKVKEE